METAPRPNRPQRLPASAPLDVVIYKVTKRASDVWDQFTEADGAELWQIQMEHAARPSAIFNLRDSFQDFLKQADSDSGIPTSLDVLQQKAGIKLTLADRNDPDKVGFVQWRVAFYVAGDKAVAVENFFMLLDDFFSFKSKALAKDIEIHVRPHTSAQAEVTSDLVESLSYEHLTFHEAVSEAQLPLKMFEAQPVVGKRIVTIFIQPESGTHVSVLFGGNTWNFRSALDEAGVKGAVLYNIKVSVCVNNRMLCVRGAYLEDEGGDDQQQKQANQNGNQNGGRKYFRVMRSLDVSSEEQAKSLQGVLENVFHGLAMKAVVETPPEEDSDVESWINSLKQIDCLHFVDDEAGAA